MDVKKLARVFHMLEECVHDLSGHEGSTFV